MLFDSVPSVIIRYLFGWDEPGVVMVYSAAGLIHYRWFPTTGVAKTEEDLGLGDASGIIAVCTVSAARTRVSTSPYGLLAFIVSYFPEMYECVTAGRGACFMSMEGPEGSKVVSTRAVFMNDEGNVEKETALPSLSAIILEKCGESYMLRFLFQRIAETVTRKWGPVSGSVIAMFWGTEDHNRVVRARYDEDRAIIDFVWKLDSDSGVVNHFSCTPDARRHRLVYAAVADGGVLEPREPLKTLLGAGHPAVTDVVTLPKPCVQQPQVPVQEGLDCKFVYSYLK